MKKRNDQQFRTGDTVVHLKSKGVYEIIAIAVHEKTEEPLVIYQHESNGRIWARSQAEFNDGRFVKL